MQTASSGDNLLPNPLVIFRSVDSRLTKDVPTPGTYEVHSVSNTPIDQYSVIYTNAGEYASDSGQLVIVATDRFTIEGNFDVYFRDFLGDRPKFRIRGQFVARNYQRAIDEGNPF